VLLLSVEAGLANSRGDLQANALFEEFTGRRFAPSRRAQRVLGSFLNKVLGEKDLEPA